MLSGWLPVADGEAGISQIVGQLNALKDAYGALPAIRAAAVRIAGGVTNDDDRGNAARLARFVRRTVVYQKDPLDAEFIQTPDLMLVAIFAPGGRGQVWGDCDDHVLLFAALAQSLGIPTRIVGVKLPGSLVYDHVIALSDIAGALVEIDLCAKDGFQPLYPEKLFA